MADVMLAKVGASRGGEGGWAVRYADAAFMGGLSLMILTLPISEALKNIGYFVALGGWVLKRATRRDFRITFTPIGVFLSIYLLASLLSAAFAFDRWEGFRGVWDVFRYLSLFLMMVNDVDSKQKILFCASLFVASTAMGVTRGLFDYFTGTDIRIGIKTLGNPVHVATYLVIMLALCMSLLFLMDWPFWAKIAVGVVTGAAYLAIFLTYSRGGWIACLAVLLFLAVSLKRWEPVVAVVFLTMIIVIGLSGMGRLWARHFETLARLDEDVNLIERVKMWRGAVLSIKDRPVLGIGPRNFRNLDHERYGFQRTDVYGRRWTDAHNLFLTVLAERGLLGFLSLIGFLVCYVSECIRRRPPKDALSQALWHAAMGSFITIVVGGMVNTTLHAEGAIAFSSMTALMLASSEAAQP
ncbi:MAG: O-antigen ligase family protein [Candidatus Methylomirabilales bacterium]